MGPLSLRELRSRYPEMFYPQDWYDGESFMDRKAPAYVPAPTRVLPKQPLVEGEVYAASLAAAYLTDPTNPIWTRYLWTADTDHLGQRVFVGDNGKGFEIHRHLHLTDRWGWPTWG